MSVPVHERGEAGRAFLDQAEQLQIMTDRLVMNNKYVGKKYRLTWANRVLGYAMNIFENARRANILYPTSQELLDRRIEYLRIAESDAEALQSQITFARTRFNIPKDACTEWELLCTKTRRSLKNRIAGDIKIGVKK